MTTERQRRAASAALYDPQVSPADRRASASLRLTRGLKACRRVLRKLPVTAPLGVVVKGALLEEGWLRSFRETRSVDRLGNPVPWYTYPCTHFLEQRLQPDMRVFEYGSGLSTLWYAGRVGEVMAVEHDERWAALIGGQLPSNASILFRPDEDRYVAAIDDHGYFDVVVVDGLARPRSAQQAVPHLTDGGVIVWDNADWVDFQGSLPDLNQLGFRSLGFRGMGPINRQRWETAILYRDANCLGI